MTRFAGISMMVIGLSVATQNNSRAAFTTVLDQIGPNASSLVSEAAYTSQIFGAPYNTDNIAVVDNFSITKAGTTLAEVDAAVLGFGGFTAGDYSNITAVHVEIYSSLAAPSSSLTGDVYDDAIKLSDLSFTAPFGGDKYSALAQIAVNVTLGVGNYYLAVIPTLNYSNTGAEIGVYASTYAGDSNAYQVNPGGGFGFPGNSQALGINAAYRILAQPAAVPEPSSIVLCGLAGLLGLGVRRACRNLIA